jgi:hypothetical protein
METERRSRKMIKANKFGREIPVIQDSCTFTGYDAELLMNETEKLRELITKRGTLEILKVLRYTRSWSMLGRRL